MSISKFLNREYYLPNSRKIRIILSSGFGLIIFLMLISFSPFGIQNLEVISLKFVISLGYSFIAIIVWFLGLALIKTFRANKGKLWQIIIALVIMQFIAGFISMLYNNIIFNNPSYFDFFLRFQLIVFLMGIIPCFYIFLLMETNFYNQLINVNSNKPETKTTKKKIQVTLHDQNPDKSLTTIPDKIIYIQSQDNYIKIVRTTTEDKVESIMLRATLNSAIEILSGFDYFIQCHRSYLINLHFVEKVNGTALSKKCILRNSDSTIPISRSQIQFVLDKINSEN